MLLVFLPAEDVGPSGQFFLGLGVDVLWNNGFLTVLDIVLRKGAVILDPCLLDEVRSDGLLQKGVTDVLLVSKDAMDGTQVPPALFASGLY